MDITHSIYAKLMNSIPKRPPEIGGILGGINGIIDQMTIDYGMRAKEKKCCYIPDVNRLNLCIQDWYNKDIEFYGIFHTHFYGIDSLSKGDEKYINNIMMRNKLNTDKLYFPLIVLPECIMKAYMGVIRENKCFILEDTLNIV